MNPAILCASRLFVVFIATAAAIPYWIAFDPVAVASIIGYNEDNWVAVPCSPKPRRSD
jgi:hypothetical protein